MPLDYVSKLSFHGFCSCELLTVRYCLMAVPFGC
uniref:Uncharacterized protein n=1 Tax=Arundo donax TaxID=35708 RepID=A0A0A9G201_ARUDO